MKSSLSGNTIDGRYELLTQIGSGGMGTVYKAIQHPFDREVAIKMLLAELPDDPDARARFEREAMAISALKHKNIVMFYGYGIYCGAPYMVMEYINGRSLQQLLASNQPLAPKYAMGIMEQIAEALSCAHAHGLVHRDLKPSNVMIVGNEQSYTVKIIDFGLARLLPSFGKEIQKLTEAGSTVGSVLYMSPEQCLGKESDERSDIYALGCILQHCLTGVPPFEGDHSVVVMQRHLCEAMPPLNSRVPDIAPGLQAIVDHAVEKDANDRYQSAEEMLKDIRNFQTGNSTNLTSARAKSSSSKSSPELSPLLHQREKRKTALKLTVALVVCAIFLGGGFLYLKNQQQTQLTVPKPKEREADNPMLLFRQAEEALGDRKLNEALRLFERVVESERAIHLLSPSQRLQSYLTLSHLYANNNQLEQACTVALEGLTIPSSEQEENPQRVKNLVINYVKACDQLGRQDKADQFLRYFIKKQQESGLKNWGSAFMLLVARSETRDGKAKGIQLLQQNLNSLPTDSDKFSAMIRLGAMLHGANRRAEGDAVLRKATVFWSQHNFDNPDLELNLGTAYLTLRDYDHAKQCLEPYADDPDTGPVVWPSLAVIAGVKGDLASAKKMLDDTLAYANKSDTGTRYALRKSIGSAAQNINDFFVSKHDYKKAAQFQPYIKFLQE